MLTGSDGPNRLLPGAGADTVFGLGANDEIHAKDSASDTGNCGAGASDKLFKDAGDVFDLAGPDACEIVS
jgi:hypothetical protein